MTNQRELGRYTAADVDNYYASGQWSKDNYTDLLKSRAQSHADKVFVTDGINALTFAELYEASQRLALGLRRSGVKTGDRVAVQLPNWAEFFTVASALARIGAVMVPIMPIYRKDEVAHVVSDAGVSVAIAPEDFKGFKYAEMFDDIRSESGTLTTVLAVRVADGARDALQNRNVGVLDDVFVTDVAADAIDAELDVRVHPDDPYVIVYTSGTTSRPKGCLHTFNTYASSSRALVIAFGQRPTSSSGPRRSPTPPASSPACWCR
jgi:cyclohexanecarboxylate-CoA ligase